MPVEHLVAANALTIVADVDSPLLDGIDGFDQCSDEGLDAIVRGIKVKDIHFQIPVDQG